MKTYKVEIEMQVAESWIQDGFRLEDKQQLIEDKLGWLLPYAESHEFKVKVTKIIPPVFTLGELEELGLIS
jgi:hypothetical protein